MSKTSIAERHLIPFDASFKLKDVDTTPPADAPSKKEAAEVLDAHIKELSKLQIKLYAEHRRAVLLIFQAMDAAGKDGTIRAVMTGINPAGCQVYSFKTPSAEELDHDFLWRTTRCLPERGRIGIFNRSYYEEVLVVRVHPELLDKEHLPEKVPLERLWEERFESIRDHENHLARSGTLILKFFLHVSKEEQKRRFIDRLSDPRHIWKFSPSDLTERRNFDAYMTAYQEALRATSRPWAPWYAIPADSKPYLRLAVCEIIRDKLEGMGLEFPRVDKNRQAELDAILTGLEAEK